jgi:NAD(P)H-hydrate epimerase
MNRSGLPILSIDVPSGVSSDESRVPGTTVKATTTLCLGAMKLSAAFHPSVTAYGKITFSPICFDEKLLFQQPSRMEMYTEEDAADFLPVKTYRTHKYSAGKVLVIAGSRGMHGAPSLAANAALRSGAGLVRVAMPAGVYAQAVPHLLEIIGVPLGSETSYELSPEDLVTLQPELDWADAIVVGPGLGKGEKAQAFLKELLPLLSSRKVVWDGDALEILSQAVLPDLAAMEGWVATPHAGEYRRMGGDYDYEAPLHLLESLRAFTRGKGFSVLLKGPTTAFSQPEGRLLAIPAGNPGMATAGSGDVLAGIVGAFLAVRPAEIAAPMAAFLHGRSGDAARRDRGTLGMAASDLILYLPLALKDLEDLAAEDALDAEHDG